MQLFFAFLEKLKVYLHSDKYCNPLTTLQHEQYTYCSDPVESDGSLIKLSATVCEARSHSEGW